MRPRGEETRAALIEGAEQLMLEEGYAAVTARRLMQRANLKSQLLHYHFASIDDLFVAVIQRRFDVNVRLMLQSLSVDDPLKGLWAFIGDKDNARLSMEFLALASHRVAVRDEVKRYAEQLRRMQTEAFERYFRLRDVSPEVPPMVSAMVLSSLWQALHMEEVHGIELGHAELKEFIDSRLHLVWEGKPSLKRSAPASD